MMQALFMSFHQTSTRNLIIKEEMINNNLENQKLIFLNIFNQNGPTKNQYEDDMGREQCRMVFLDDNV